MELVLDDNGDLSIKKKFPLFLELQELFLAKMKERGEKVRVSHGTHILL